MKAMIFAAGLGTRLKPLTDTMPKALVPVGGSPLLDILMKRLLQAGVTEVVINVHHFARQIKEHVQAMRQYGVQVHFSDETDMLLETGGGIKKASCFFDEPFLVHNVDILNNVDLSAFYTRGKQHAATLLVSERKTQRYLLFDDRNHLVGWTNLQTGEVKSPYPDLEVEKCKKYAFAGVHTCSPQLFPYFEQWGDRFSIIDFYLSICDREDICGDPMPGLQIMDVGKQETLALADDFLKNIYG